MRNLLARLKEPSSWAGLSSLFAIVSAILPAQYQVYAQALAGGAAAIAVKLPEQTVAPK